jgi:hypothetical protein
MSLTRNYDISPHNRGQDKTLDEFRRINGTQNRQWEGEMGAQDLNYYAETGARETLGELSSAAERFIGNMESQLQTLQKVFLFLVHVFCFSTLSCLLLCLP